MCDIIIYYNTYLPTWSVLKIWLLLAVIADKIRPQSYIYIYLKYIDTQSFIGMNCVFLTIHLIKHSDQMWWDTKGIVKEYILHYRLFHEKRRKNVFVLHNNSYCFNYLIISWCCLRGFDSKRSSLIYGQWRTQIKHLISNLVRLKKKICKLFDEKRMWVQKI